MSSRPGTPTGCSSRSPAAGVIRGIALNPGTPLEVIEPLLDELELVFLLAVNPGWGGQKFLPGTEARLAKAREMIGDREILLEVDGGITRANIEHVATLGADLIVSGSAIYDGKAPLDNARYMLDAVARPTQVLALTGRHRRRLP